MFSEPYQASYKNEIASFSQTDINKIVSSDRSLLVAVTRHPLSRFTSAWAQKFRRGGEFDKGRNQWLNQWPELENYLLNEQMQTTHRFEMLILKRPLPIKIIANVFFRITFNDFVNFFTEKSSPQKFNPHWRLASGKVGCVFPMVIWPAPSLPRTPVYKFKAICAYPINMYFYRFVYGL